MSELIKRSAYHSVAIVHNHWVHYEDELFRALVAEGCDIVVLYTAFRSSQRREEAQGQCRYPYLIAHDGAYEDANQFVCALRVWRRLREIRPDCLIISGWYDLVCWCAWLWARVYGVPMVLWSESNSFDHRRRAVREWVKRWYVRSFYVVHVYGSSSKEYVERLGVPTQRIVTKGAVVDGSLFAPLQGGRRRPDHKVLAFVGRLAKEKNLARLLLALSGVRQNTDRVRLILQVIGYGPEEDELRTLAVELGIEPFVEFLGRVPQSDLPSVICSCDGLVLASTSETWGLVVNEAMCCGVPVLVSERCGCAADLVNSETGWTFDPYDVRELTAVLEEFADCPQERLEKMGVAARAISERYSSESCARVVAASVRSAIQGRGVGARGR